MPRAPDKKPKGVSKARGLLAGRHQSATPSEPAPVFDPMPTRIEYCSPILKSKVPEGPDWYREIKFDGYRVSVFKRNDDVRILSKGGIDWTRHFPAIVEEARHLNVGTIVLDGEAVMLDVDGHSDFNLLQQAVGSGSSRKVADQALMFAFDVLYFDGRDIAQRELIDRRPILEEIIPTNAFGIRLSELIEADPKILMDHICALKLEGVVAKHRHRRYRPGRSGDWVKIKCIQRETFAVIGFKPDGNGLSSLLLGAYDNGELRYVGSVGSGIGWKTAVAIRGALEKLRKKPAVITSKSSVVYTRPAVLVEVKFRGWTSERMLRHASYEAVRHPKDDPEVFDLATLVDFDNPEAG